MSRSDLDLEAFVNRELGSLPCPEAPATLLPRVLEAARVAVPRVWYQRAWLTWPVAWQLASIAGLVALVVALSLAWPTAQSMASSVVARVARAQAAGALAVQREAGPTFSVARVLWTSVLQPLLVYALALVTLMGVACGAGAAALNRVALGGATRQ